MSIFDFSKEMTYGKKHFRIVKHDLPLNFREILIESFGCHLETLHKKQRNSKLVINKQDEYSTIFHDVFRNNICIHQSDFHREYINFVSNVIFPFLGINHGLVSITPTLEIQFPNNFVTCQKKYDSDENYNIETGWVNFVIALTEMSGTSCLFIEKMPRMEDFKSVILKSGECICLNTNLCSHYNKINKTGKTRVSLQFSVFPNAKLKKGSFYLSTV